MLLTTTLLLQKEQTHIKKNRKYNSSHPTMGLYLLQQSYDNPKSKLSILLTKKKHKKVTVDCY
jgi:hypothetical protein